MYILMRGATGQDGGTPPWPCGYKFLGSRCVAASPFASPFRLRPERHRRRSPASQGFATTSRSHPVMVIASAHDAYDAYDAYALTNKQTRDFDTH